MSDIKDDKNQLTADQIKKREVSPQEAPCCADPVDEVEQAFFKAWFAMYHNKRGIFE
jgi:hypothetical protein